MSKKDNIPTKYYELADKGRSGFIMDGTAGKSYQQELSAPAIRWIPTLGKMGVKSEGGAISYKEIRYLSGCDSIDKTEQEKNGFTPKKLEDKIGMENGFMTVKREGDSIGLYDYLEKSFYNLDNPLRPSTATAIYREVKIDKKAEVLLDEDETITRAKSLVYELRVSTGDKTRPYKYDTDRINSICRLVNVWDETPERQLMHLLNKATTDSENFIKIVQQAEQVIVTEVTHALELKVIRFTNESALFTEDNKVLFNFGVDKLKQEEKIQIVASYLGTEQGNEKLTILRSKLELEKAKNI